MRNIYLKEGIFRINRPREKTRGTYPCSGSHGNYTREQAIKLNQIKKR